MSAGIHNGWDTVTYVTVEAAAREEAKLRARKGAEQEAKKEAAQG